VIHFDFEDRYQDELIVGSAISRREGVIWSVVLHSMVILLIALTARYGLLQPSAEELEAQREEMLAQLKQQQQDSPRFVFMEPRIERPPERLRERVEMSDLDRRSETRERAPVPENPLPFSRGNTADKVEASPPPAPEPEPQPIAPESIEPQPNPQTARVTPPSPDGFRRDEPTDRRPVGGSIRDAIKNLEKYTQNQEFNNPQGGNTDPGSQIQFDSKGVEFGPWLRRFVAQVKRNWFVPLSAMTFRGRVVLQFNVHRDGRITDVRIVRPSDIDSFNRAAFDAIIGSNPTEPLPPEYPDDKVLFTVTFFYNEQP
jgi:TonB family protein